MKNSKVRYKTGFSSGALLFKDSDAIISNISDFDLFIKGEESIDLTIVPVNSETSKKRYAIEVEKRIKNLFTEIIDLYSISNESDKKLILFYAICKQYPLITDFMLEVVVNKYLNLDTDLTINDFQNFLYIKADNHPELEEITEYTKYKLSQVMLKMLKELGMLVNKKLQKIESNPQIIKSIVNNGDKWFMDVILLDNNEKREILER